MEHPRITASSGAKIQCKREATEYKYVSKCIYERYNTITYSAHIPKRNGAPGWSKSFDDLRKAAIAVDKKLIEWGKEPVNILKRL